MKIKKFKNLWTMGLLLCCGAFIILYLIKLIFPEFVVGVAQLPSIISIGDYIDTHIWAYYTFYFITTFIIGYFYCCACCRKKKLDKIDLAILVGEIILLFLTEKFLFQYYFEINIFAMLIMPTIMCFKNKCNDIKYLYSIVICFTTHSIFQILSLQIRDISSMITTTNSATFTILLIDTYIWEFILYNYFNYKENEHYGKT